MEKIFQVQQESNQKIIQKLTQSQQELNQQIASILKDELKSLEKEKEELKKERETLKKEREELKKEKEEWAVLANKLNKAQIRIGVNRVKLDIGGQIFATSLSTLTSQKGSFFEAMFSGRWEVKPEDDGCYFIDRAPTVFGHILNYLRRQPPTLDMLSTKEVQLLKEDAEFYQLPGLSDYLNFPPAPRFVSGPNYTVSTDGLTITKTSTQDQWNVTAIMNPIPSSGIHHLKLKLVTSKNGFIMIGICPLSINQSQLDNYQNCGWYFFCYGGTLYSGPPRSVSNKSYYSTSAMLSGREVGVKMDTTNGQISFTVDGVDRGVAYTDIPVNQSLCFCVLMRTQNDSVRIME